MTKMPPSAASMQSVATETAGIVTHPRSFCYHRSGTLTRPPSSPVLVVAYDGSADADVALEWAMKSVAAQDGVTIHLLEALGLPPMPQQPWMTPPEELLADSERLAWERLEAQGAVIRKRGIAAQLHLRRWLPAESIVDLAKELHAGLIVLGRRGRSAKRLWIGSVSGDVSRLANCPVVVVRGERFEAPPRRILVALDGSAPSRVAARAAAQLFPRAQAIALNVTRGDDALSPSELETEAAALGFAAGNLRSEAAEGDPAATILDLARKAEVDLIAAGRRGRGPLQELLFGSVAEKLLQLAPCPILLAH